MVRGPGDAGSEVPVPPGGDVDLEGLTRPLLAALATIAGPEATYLTVFDWDRQEQEVRFVHSAGTDEIEEGSRLPLPPGVSEESLPGVTRSPPQMPGTYVSVPVVLAKHELFGMVCGAGRQAGPVTERVVSVMEFLAGSSPTTSRASGSPPPSSGRPRPRRSSEPGPGTSPSPSTSSRRP